MAARSDGPARRELELRGLLAVDHGLLWYRSPKAPTDTLSTVSPSATSERMEASMAVDPLR
jgi:hypothetical protein